MSDKSLFFANFNITFGNDEEPMLDHFINIIYPALKSKLMRGKEDEYPQFFFDNIEIKEVNNLGIVLAGNYIKQTEYTVYTKYEGGELKASPSTHPTSPYSRFIVFLKNHRMILVKNESQSPDIRSFQKTLISIISQYIRQENKDRKKDDKMPTALVNIVDIPLKEDIAKEIERLQKIEWIKIRFFPLNNDLDTSPIFSDVRNQMQRLESKRANVTFNSPLSKQETINLINDQSGMSTTTIGAKDSDGGHKKIKSDSFSSSMIVQTENNIEPKDDPILISAACKNESITKTSESNLSLYEKHKPNLRQLFER